MFAEKTKFQKVLVKRGWHPPFSTYSRSAGCRTFVASSQKFAEKTKLHKLLVKGGDELTLEQFSFIVFMNKLSFK